MKMMFVANWTYTEGKRDNRNGPSKAPVPENEKKLRGPSSLRSMVQVM